MASFFFHLIMVILAQAWAISCSESLGWGLCIEQRNTQYCFLKRTRLVQKSLIITGSKNIIRI